MIHNGLAVCHMKMGEWEDAERDLQEALGKDAKDADTLANLITVSLVRRVCQCVPACDAFCTCAGARVCVQGGGQVHNTVLCSGRDCTDSCSRIWGGGRHWARMQSTLLHSPTSSR
jgi:hypothetical protein